MARLRNIFLAGLAVLLPIVGSVWVFLKVFRWADGLIGQFFTRGLAARIPGLGLVLTVLIILATGLLATNILGQTLIEWGQRVFSRLPIIRSVYPTLRQVVEMMTRKEGQGFRQVVLLEYPRLGLWSIGLVTSERSGAIGQKTGADLVHVLVPTTPNPTSGYLLLVPRSDLVPLDMNVQEAMQLIVSGGAVSPVDEDTDPAGQAAVERR